MTTGRMGSRDRLAELMGRMADGDTAAVWALYAEFFAEIARAVRHHAQQYNAPLDADDVRGLVVDVCLMLAERAGSWDPDAGATPWTWAGPRIHTLVGGFVGQRGVELTEVPDRAADAPTSCCPADRDDEDVLVTLDGLAASHEVLALFRDALNAAGSERNRRIVLEVRLQAAAGDPSPSITVAQAYGLSSDAVRQICKRTADRFTALVRHDPRFVALDGVTVLLSGTRHGPAKPIDNDNTATTRRPGARRRASSRPGPVTPTRRRPDTCRAAQPAPADGRRAPRPSRPASPSTPPTHRAAAGTAGATGGRRPVRTARS